MENNDFLKAYGQRGKSLDYYNNSRHKFSDLYPSEQRFLKTKLKSAQSVLDIGCAAGGGACFTREINPGLFYTGIDTSDEMIKLAQKKANNSTCFYHYDGQSLNFDQKKYDLVFSLGVLHHVPTWRILLQQMIEKSNRFVCFDLRLTHDIDSRLEDFTSSYLKIAFDEEWDQKTKVPYLVINFSKILKEIENMIDIKNDSCEIFGYYSFPTELAVTPAKTVIMASFCIEKKSITPGIRIEYGKKS